MEVDKIYVSNVPYQSGTEDLVAVFEKIGHVLDLKIPTDRDRNGEERSRGFCFVQFETKDAYERALATKDLVIEGRTLRINKARPPRPKTTAYVGNIDVKATEEQVKEFFAQYKVQGCKLIKKEDERPRAFAFLEFATHEDLVAVCKGANRSEFLGKVIYVHFARPSRRPRYSRTIRRGSRRAQRTTHEEAVKPADSQ